LIEFASKKAQTRALGLTEAAKIVMNGMAELCSELGVPFVVTSTVSTKEEDQWLGRVSATHREGRAFDVRTRDWSDDECAKIVKLTEKKFKKYAATNSAGKPALVVDKSKTGAPHLHVQVAREVQG